MADVEAAVFAKRGMFLRPRRHRGSSLAGGLTRGAEHDASNDRVTPRNPIVFCAQECVDVLGHRVARLYKGMTRTASTTSHEAIPQQRPLLITVSQADEMLALSRSSIYRLIWADQLVPIRIGRSVRFSVEHLERFVADRSDVR